jgi:hypothetical protein
MSERKMPRGKKDSAETPRVKHQKTKIVAFKVEEELAEFLGKLKNKSEFIRKAILAQFSMECPLCNGGGVVPRGIHDHYKPVIQKENRHPCNRCKDMQTLALNLDGIPEGDRKRFEQYYNGGLLFCAKCYTQVPECDDCEWHVPHEHIADHIKKLHAH